MTINDILNIVFAYAPRINLPYSPVITKIIFSVSLLLPLALL